MRDLKPSPKAVHRISLRLRRCKRCAFIAEGERLHRISRASPDLSLAFGERDALLFSFAEGELFRRRRSVRRVPRRFSSLSPKALSRGGLSARREMRKQAVLSHEIFGASEETRRKRSPSAKRSAMKVTDVLKLSSLVA